MRAFIYTITLTVTGDKYLGSTKQIPPEKRWVQHRSTLHSGCHASDKLQTVWDQYGGEHFVFEIIEECTHDNVREREQHYIDTLNPALNVCLMAGGGTGIKPANFGAIMSAAQKGKPISDRKRAAMLENIAKAREKSPVNQPGYIPVHRVGTKHTDETLAQMRASARILADKRMASGQAAETGRKSSATKLAKGISASPRQIKVLNILTAEPDRWFSSPEIVALTGLKRDNTNAALRALVERGKIERRGHVVDAQWKHVEQST